MQEEAELQHLKGDGYKDPHCGVSFKLTSNNDSESTDTTCRESNLEHVELEKDRGVWANKLEFFLAIMGYTVGIGSVWRFPIICSRNGGGAFLIPFFFFLITSGGPLYYLEVCLGQFTGKSAGLAFEFCPMLKGLGCLQVALSLICLWYAITILAWVLYFLYCSFYAVLPWTTCHNAWNTDKCSEISELWSGTSTMDIANTSSIEYNISSAAPPVNSSFDSAIQHSEFQYSSSAYEFWEYHVIGRSSGLEDMGSIQLHLVVCLFLAWVFCIAATIKGVKTLGKVVYVTATAPYVFLTIMFIKGLTLDGAMDGIEMFLTPDFSKLLTVQVWLEAAIQVFYSLGPCWGGVITMASYNKFHQKSFWSSTLCVVCAGLTSFYNGMVVFTLLGFMAKSSGRTVEQVAKQSGPGLAFVAFPTAFSMMPLPHLWSVVFFLMLIAVVFDSLFGELETVTSGIIDLFPHQLIKRRVLVNIITGVCFFITGLPLTMNGGIYIFQLADWYFSSFALLVGSCVECIAICWIYGTDRFARDIHMMTGRDVSVILRVMWTVVIPLFIMVVFVVMLAKYSTPAYGDGYVYSLGAVAIGIFLGMVPIISMIGVGIVSVLSQEGSLVQRFKLCLNPSAKWAPNDTDSLVEYKLKPHMCPNTWWGKFQLNIRGKVDNPVF